MYKRVLLKLSGESLGGNAGKGLDTASLQAAAEEIASAAKAGLQIAIVNGGGNIFRGLQGVGKGFDRVDGDKMGMLATVINSLALSMFIKEQGVNAQVFTATPMEPVAKYYMRDDAVKVMEEGGVALIAGGTGNPFFTTDTAAALRASEINAEAMLMAKNGVDGVYTDDPNTNPNAKKLENINYDDIIKNGLKIMDTSACALCKQNNIPIVVFDFKKEDGIKNILNGEKLGTYIS